MAPRRSYHHGDLRRALLDAALDHIGRDGVASLTVQATARQVQVSSGAPYHHFADRAELLASLATEGFEALVARMSAAVTMAATPVDRVAALTRAYLTFAAECSSHYRVMFVPDVADRERFAAMHAAADRGLQLFVRVLTEALPDLPPGQVLGRALTAWSTCHGFAWLRLDGVLGNMPALPSVAQLEASIVVDVAEQAVRPAPRSSAS